MGALDRIPEGVRVEKLETHTDDRGELTEIFRRSWDVAAEIVQWNAVASRPHALRGVHYHVLHDDYLVLLQGRMLLGLHDLRPDSPTARCSAVRIAIPLVSTGRAAER